MKSYKDIDKSIVMNAPEGAMWVHSADNDLYYKVTTQGRFLVYDMEYSNYWDTSVHNFKKIFNNLIPLPNVEIPWEATEDSVCPVAEGANIIVKEVCGYTRQIKVNSNNIYWNTKPLTGNQIASYKIIDEEYLPLKEDEHLKEQEDDPAIEALVEYLSKEEQKVHTFTYQKPVIITLPEYPKQKLIKDLEFLQILANKFPEIKDKVIELMEVELDAWWHGTFEEQGDE